jgi:SAM-dependent methyltransferase
MKSEKDILEANLNIYEDLYMQGGGFLRYPADWVVRFQNMYLKDSIPEKSRILDYGCGSGNNSVFLLQKGYEVFGVDVAPSFKKLIKMNLNLNHLDASLINNFDIINSDDIYLDYPDNHFDFILSNQVLYYMSSVKHLKKVCLELKRVLRPNGVVFFTMMGTQNYYITHFLKQIHSDRVYEVRIEDEKHRLNGTQEHVLITKDEQDLCYLFDSFKSITTGYFDQKMFDLYSNFHYIFVGKKT